MRKFISLAIFLFASTAIATEGELNLHVSPVFSLIQRHDHLNYGFGGYVSTRYGINNFLSIEGLFLTERLNSLADTSFSGPKGPGTLFYDVTRFSLIPSLVLNLGYRFIFNLSAGVGYRSELQTNRSGWFLQGALPMTFDSLTVHELIAATSASFEYRFYDRFMVATRVAFAFPLVASEKIEKNLDMNVALLLGMYFYP